MRTPQAPLVFDQVRLRRHEEPGISINVRAQQFGKTVRVAVISRPGSKDGRKEKRGGAHQEGGLMEKCPQREREGKKEGGREGENERELMAVCGCVIRFKRVPRALTWITTMVSNFNKLHS